MTSRFFEASLLDELERLQDRLAQRSDEKVNPAEARLPGAP
jgi:hypothetical protein